MVKFRITRICAKTDNTLLAIKIGFTSVIFSPTAEGETTARANVTMETLQEPKIMNIQESKVNLIFGNESDNQRV